MDALQRRFEAVFADWDGTVVTDRAADASRVRELVETLSGLGVDVAIVTGTELRNVDAQLGARPRGPGRLYLCLNRGSEVFLVGRGGVETLERRRATADENAALDRAAALAVERLGRSGLECRVISSRLHRRKIDLIPSPAWEDPPKARIGELLAAVDERLAHAGIDGLAEVIAIVHEVATEAGMDDPRVTSDAKHVEVGLTDKSDSIRWLLADLAVRGIPPSDVLIVGDEFGPLGRSAGSDSLMLVPGMERATVVSVGVEPSGVPPRVHHLGGGPDAFATLLEDQIRRREAGELPAPTEDPEWVYTLEGIDREREHVHETLLTLSDGRIGTNGSPLGTHRAAAPEVLHAGVYDGEGADERLLPGPVWTGSELLLDVAPRPAVRRQLDMRAGTLRHRIEIEGAVSQALALSSLARPGFVALRVDGSTHALTPGSPLVPPAERPTEAGRAGGATWVSVPATDGGIAAAAFEDVRSHADARSDVDRLGVYRGSSYGRPSRIAALDSLHGLDQRSFDLLWREQREAWARRWADADVEIVGAPELQKAVRFCLFHLMAAVADTSEAAVGARGLSGHGYRGHVFWDADVFTLPFLAATHPAAARAMLEYRVRRLPQARTIAAAEGRNGARFPWESARTGAEVTPSTMLDLAGAIREVRTGDLEVHVVADVAWAAWWYTAWTDDAAFAHGQGRELLLETARYWASRVRVDLDGRAHIDGVIGPDEYHEDVCDNAYTNVLARWNLRRAAEAGAGGAASAGEVARWRTMADALVDGYDVESGIYEQFDGFIGLEPLIVSEAVPRRPLPADVVLGVERVARAQIVKQADVLMAYHLLPDEMVEGSLEANVAFYEPRTAHGSSLSPGVHAAVLARAGRLDEAVDALELAARIDLDDLTGTTATGLHLAAMGSVWQALAMGFAGLRPHGNRLAIDPVIPAAWEALQLRVRFRGARVVVRIEGTDVTVTTDAPTALWLGEPVDADARRRVRARRASDGLLEVTDR